MKHCQENIAQASHLLHALINEAHFPSSQCLPLLYPKQTVCGRASERVGLPKSVVFAAACEMCARIRPQRTATYRALKKKLPFGCPRRLHSCRWCSLGLWEQRTLKCLRAALCAWISDIRAASVGSADGQPNRSVGRVTLSETSSACGSKYKRPLHPQSNTSRGMRSD